MNRFTVHDLKRAIAQMEDEDLPLEADVEVWINNKLYYITRVAHFHVVPNLILELKIKKPEDFDEKF